ncbi:MAG: hypothetical protein KBS86_03255 [Proteobacteria bacterium]|nr:hypothetical protein [Candidatus Enterousia scatequi]
MLTKIDLCSMALLKLGEKPIQSWTDDCAPAQLARTLFGPIVDTLITMHPWRFATKTFDLLPDAHGDFIIPSCVLRILHCKGQIVGNKIFSNADNLRIVALTRVPVESFPSYFASLAATKLAIEFCIPLTSDQTIMRMLIALYDSELQSAKFIDSTTSVSQDIDNFALINARF